MHLPIKLNTHPWVQECPQISNLQTELKYLDLLHFYSIFTDLAGYSPGGWVGVWLHEGIPHAMCAYICTCTHMLTCVHTCMHVKHDKHGCLHGGGQLQFPSMFILALYVCVCVCMHTHVHMSRDTPMPPDVPTLLLPPQSHREPESQKVYKS